MKKMMCVVAAGVLMLTACNNKQPEAAATETTTETNSEPTKPDYKLADLSDKTDHVCGMELSEGGIADTLHYGDKVYGFCAAECKAEFAKNPDQYLANK